MENYPSGTSEHPRSKRQGSPYSHGTLCVYQKSSGALLSPSLSSRVVALSLEKNRPPTVLFPLGGAHDQPAHLAHSQRAQSGRSHLARGVPAISNNKYTADDSQNEVSGCVRGRRACVSIHAGASFTPPRLSQPRYQRRGRPPVSHLVG